MPFGVHPLFIVVLLIIVLIVFGPGKLPEIGGAVGRGIREFRKESDKLVNEIKSEVSTEPTPSVSSDPVVKTAEPAQTNSEKSA